MFSLFKRKPRVYHDGEFAIEHILGVQVIAIERTDDDETLIGYLPADRAGEIREWYLPVSLDKHNELLRRFRVQRSIPTTLLSST